MTMLSAKRAIEAVCEDGRIILQVPMVEDVAALVSELTAAGFTAAVIPSSDTPDIRALRETMGLTREQFAARYGLEVETLRNWETGKRMPDRTARSYLRVIANAPEMVERAYAPTPG